MLNCLRHNVEYFPLFPVFPFPFFFFFISFCECMEKCYPMSRIVLFFLHTLLNAFAYESRWQTEKKSLQRHLCSSLPVLYAVSYFYVWVDASKITMLVKLCTGYIVLIWK